MPLPVGSIRPIVALAAMAASIGVAAALENLHARARRQRLARRDDAERRRDDRSADDRSLWPLRFASRRILRTSN